MRVSVCFMYNVCNDPLAVKYILSKRKMKKLKSYKILVVLLFLSHLVCGQKIQFETAYQAILNEFDKVDKIIESIRKDSINHELKIDTLATYIDTLMYKAELLDNTYDKYECEYYLGEFSDVKNKVYWTFQNMKPVSESYVRGDVYYWQIISRLISVENKIKMCKSYCDELNEMYIKYCH